MKNFITFPHSVKSGEINFRLNSDDWSKEEIKSLRKFLSESGEKFSSRYQQHPTKCIGNYCFKVFNKSFADFESMMNQADNLITNFKISTNGTV